MTFAAMNPALLRFVSDSNDWNAIMPELLLGCLALFLLVLEIALPKKQHALIPGVAILGQLAVLLGLLINFNVVFEHPVTFGGLLYHSHSGQLMRIFFLLSSVLVSLLGTIALAKQRMPRIEFFHIVLVVTAALMLLVQSFNFVMLFVALETVTVGFYILVSYTRTNPLSLEAGLKYLILGALSSALLLFGIVLLYGAVGRVEIEGIVHTGFEFPTLQEFLASHPHNFLAGAGIVLVLAGVAFKIGAVPFQIWIPDVYQGAPTPVTAFLAVSSKAAGFAVLFLLVHRVFPAYLWLTLPILGVMAAATIIFGNLAALTQQNVKRLIGLSGVSHAGYLLIGVIAAATEPSLATGAVIFYLFAYLLASFAVFGVMTHVAGPDDSDQELTHYAGLARTHPFLATVLAVGLGSLAGIPPLAGFMGKLFIFIAAFQAGLYWLLAVAIFGVVISIYYYFGWIRAAFFESGVELDAPAALGRPARTPLGLMVGVALVMLTLATVLLGVYQGSLGSMLSLH